MRTIRQPHLLVPRLQDLLHYLSRSDLQHIWVLLDIKVQLLGPGLCHDAFGRTNAIKVDDDAEILLALVAKVIHDHSTASASWEKRNRAWRNL